MSFFDFHCDTVYEATLNRVSLLKNSLAIDIKKGEDISPWIQTFAFWIPDEYRGEDAYQFFKKQYDYFKKQCKEIAELRLYSCGELDKKGCYAVLAVEGGAVLGGKLERIGDLKEAGISFLTLCWNGVNEIASGADAVGGITSFGRKVVSKLEMSNIIIDVSHLNEESFWDVAKIVSRPFVATHSNAYSICPHRRNLKDDQIKAIRDLGGLIGLNFYLEFLGGDSKKGIDSLIRHAEAFLNLKCEDVLVIGSDFDGAKMPEDILDISYIPKVKERFISEFGADLTEKIFFNNARIFFDRQGLFKKEKTINELL